MNQMVKNNKDKNKNNNSSNSVVFGQWPQTKMVEPRSFNFCELRITCLYLDSKVLDSSKMCP